MGGILRRDSDSSIVVGAGDHTGTGETNTVYTASTNVSKTTAAHAMRTSRSVLYGRLLFIAGLAAVAAALGCLAYFLMAQSEDRRAEERFDSISERALSMAQLIMEEKKLTTDSLAFVAAAANPNASAWPNVHILGYQEIATSLRLVTEGQGVSFCTIVKPGGEEQRSFEEFSYELFASQGLPENAGISTNYSSGTTFDKGIFGYKWNSETYELDRYRANTSWTVYGSKRDVLVPFIQSDLGYHTSLMLDVHHERTRGLLIDEIMDCSEEREAAGDNRECGGVTDLMWSPTNHDVDPGPAGIMFVPIFPKFDNTTLTGFIVAKTIFHDLLRHGFTEDVDGIDAVLRTSSSKAHTYHVTGGQARYVAEGDVHKGNAKYSATRHINPNYFGDFNVEYHLDLYSTEEYEDDFRTQYPWIACFGAVGIIIFTSILFFAYDFFVRREFDNKKNLLQAKRQFVRFVSHEVRTPLNTVCMGLSLMQDDFASVLGLRKDSKTPEGAPNEMVDEWMKLSQQIYQNAETAVGVLNDLLNYDKIQMGTLTLELSLLNIWSSTEKVVSEFKLAANERKIQLALDFSALEDDDEECSPTIKTAAQIPEEMKQCRVLADDIRIAQVLRNLISNGLKFSKEGGKLTVRVSEIPLRKRKEQEEITLDGVPRNLWKRGDVRIEVIDDGVGMTKEQVKNVFKDGTQYNANKLQAGGGSGLGLNIAKGIATQHGGQLMCKSDGIDKGTTFTLRLPLYDPPKFNRKDDEEGNSVGKEGLTQSISEGEDSSYEIPEFNILVVDDSDTNRKLCMKLLTKHGHQCQGASDGLEGLRMVKEANKAQRPFDCILLDYEMPNMIGPDACKAIRKLGCDSYIVGVTGNVMSEDVAHFRECGADWVLPKPFQLEALEQQWIETGLTPYSRNEPEGSTGLVRVSSDTDLELMGERVTFKDEDEAIAP